MADTIYIKSEGLFNPENGEMVNATADGAALWKVATAKPVPFVGETDWVFNMDGEMSVVDEGGAKPVSGGSVTPKTVKPFKAVYQMRTSDEFLRMSDEQKKPIMDEFFDGIVKKAHRTLDGVAINGVDPATNERLSWYDTNSFIGLCQIGETEGWDKAETLDKSINDAIFRVEEYGGEVNGVIFGTPAIKLYASEYGDNGYKYPDFAHGAIPPTFAGTDNVAKSTVMNQIFDEGYERYALIGDFTKFRWGYSDEIKFDVIDYGDPDGQGDLKRYNQVVLRGEIYLGYSILDRHAFGLVMPQDEEPEPSE